MGGLLVGRDSRRIIIAAVAIVVAIVSVRRSPTRRETPAAQMPFAAEVATGLGEVVTRSTASQSGASTADMAKAPDVSAAAESADVSAAETSAHMSATTETSAVSTTVSTPTTSAAARKRISGQSPGESGSRCQDDHRFT
jgi:hypothetical protein